MHWLKNDELTRLVWPGVLGLCSFCGQPMNIKPIQKFYYIYIWICILSRTQNLITKSTHKKTSN